MGRQADLSGRAQDEFARHHRVFVEHFGYAIIFAWATSALAAWRAPWVSNIRGLIDPFGRAESTGSYLFSLPVLMTAALAVMVLCADALRRTQVLRRQALEFGFAGLVAFGVFCMAIERAVTALQLGH